MHFLVEASAGNGNGIFDAAYDFGAGGGDEGQMTGSPQEIGAEVARFLALLTLKDCEAMKYGTDRFFIQLIITPVEPLPRLAASEPS